jgi:hypothetical protein
MISLVFVFVFGVMGMVMGLPAPDATTTTSAAISSTSPSATQTNTITSVDGPVNESQGGSMSSTTRYIHLIPLIQNYHRSSLSCRYPCFPAMVLLAPEDMHMLLTARKTTILQRRSSKSNTRRIILRPSESVYSRGSTDGLYGQSGYASDSR